MEKDYWVYQSRQNPVGQWALYVVKDTRRSDMTVTVYSEAIGNPTNCVTLHESTRRSPAMLANDVVVKLLEFTEVTSGDMKQLVKAFAEILSD